MYEHLSDYLDELGITDDSLPSISRAMEEKTWYRNSVASEVYWEIARNVEEEGGFLQLPGFRLIVQGDSLASRKQQLQKTIFKKLVSMTTSSLFQFGQIEHDALGFGDPFNRWEPLAQDQFVQFLLRNNSVIKSNLLVPVATLHYTKIEGWSEEKERTVKETFRIDKSSFGISLDYEELYSQLSEAPARTTPPAGAISLYLPHLTNVDLKDIVRLRENEQEAFIRYHRTLLRLFEDSKIADNEHTLLYAMREADDGIRRVRETFENLRRSSRYSTAGIVVGLASAALCVIAPKEVAEYLRALVGGATASAAFQYFSTRRAADDQAKNTDFYFPWLLSELSK